MCCCSVSSCLASRPHSASLAPPRSTRLSCAARGGGGASGPFCAPSGTCCGAATRRTLRPAGGEAGAALCAVCVCTLPTRAAVHNQPLSSWMCRGAAGAALTRDCPGLAPCPLQAAAGHGAGLRAGAQGRRGGGQGKRGSSGRSTGWQRGGTKRRLHNEMSVAHTPALTNAPASPPPPPPPLLLPSRLAQVQYPDALPAMALDLSNLRLVAAFLSKARASSLGGERVAGGREGECSGAGGRRVASRQRGGLPRAPAHSHASA